MLQQLGQPFAVSDIRLPAGDVLDVLRIDQQQLEVAFQQVVDRLPVDARGLHGDVGDPGLGQPVRQSQQLFGHRAEGAYLLLAGAILGQHQPAGNDRLLVDVQAATAGIDGSHRSLLLGQDRARRPSAEDSAVRAASKRRNNLSSLGTPGPNSVSSSGHQTLTGLGSLSHPVWRLAPYAPLFIHQCCRLAAP